MISIFISLKEKYLMPHTLVIRGFDDQVHVQLGDMANQRGVSINSIVKDAVDMWLNQKKSEIRKKHHLIIYSDDESIKQLIKSMDRLAIESNLYRCFFGPPDNPSIKLLTKLEWYNGTVIPYFYSSSSSSSQSKSKEKQHNKVQSQTPIHNYVDIIEYCNKVIDNIIQNADNKSVCCMDFLMNDVSKTSLKQALSLEKTYDSSRLAGLMYCNYKSSNLINSEITDILELFEIHDQIFILKENEIYKLHITKENVHKLFLN
jgi:hypothetical protein